MDSRQVTRIGSKRDARKAVNGTLEHIGSGCYRDVYADMSRKVVYKVDQSSIFDSDMPSANEMELDTWVRLCHMGEADLLAPATAWYVPMTVVPDRSHYTYGRCGRDECPFAANNVPNGEYHTWVLPPVTRKVLVLAMPFLPKSGRDLSRESDADYSTAARQVSDYAHRHGIIDTHDENWRLDSDGNIFITDYAGY